mgnify:FL=1
MNVYVDIDETICFYDEERDYKLAKPIQKNINKINNFYAVGHQLAYWTARGTVTKIDWFKTTENQLKKWGCKYHRLSTGKKPAYDLLICDKTKRIEEI